MCPIFVFDDVEKAMFQMDARQCELIFFILNRTKFDLREVEKAMFQGLPCHFDSFLASWPSQMRIGWGRKPDVQGLKRLFTYFRPLDQSKIRLGRIKKATFLVVAKQWELYFCVMNSQNAISMKSKKRWFKYLKSFSASWQPQNSTLLRSRERCFKWRHALGTHFLHIEHAKMLLGWCREDDASRAPMTLKPFSALRPSQNANWLRSKNRCFKGSHGPFNLFSGYGTA